ncbi:MAG: alpha/beta hydrolase [Proteobacteria bacterium]|nr:alpha/beta hydrolase [Pseudomonadota bacterium]
MLYKKFSHARACAILGIATIFAAATVSAADDWSNQKAYRQLERRQVELNSKPGDRHVPAKILPIPNVSKELQEWIAAPYNSPRWYGNHASTPADWKKMIDASTKATLAYLPQVQRDLQVTMQKSTLGGIPVYVVTPSSIPDRNKNRVALFLHGGGYVYNPGDASPGEEAMIMAAYGGYKVVVADYRMPPDHPYPAALDDAMAVYKALLKEYTAKRIAVFGTSAGGGLTLALAMRARDEGVPVPAAIGLGTPWVDLTPDGGGDTIRTLEWVDNTLISSRGYIARSAPLYAGGADLKTPYISPIFGNFNGLPPAVVTSGTRDLFLSQSVLTHRKLRQAGVEAQLQVWDGMAHAQYEAYKSPESKEVFSEIEAFFDKHMDR